MAQSATPPPHTTRSPVVVTANPIIDRVRIDPFSSTSAVVTESQLRDQNAFDLATALRRTPGVQISRYNPVGGFGGDQGGAVYIRGMGVSRPGSEIKTYIDGVPFYMGVWGHPLLDLLPVNGMQSITVYKSPQPQINGNNFASINLETKRATEDGVQVNGRVSGGYFSTFIEQVDLVGRRGDVDFMLAQGHAQSNGHRPNASGELNNVMGRIGLRLNANWSVGTSFLYVDNQARDPGDNRLPAPAVAPQYTTQAGMVSVFVSHHHGNWRGDLRVYHNRGEGNWLNQAGLEGDQFNNFQMTGVRWKEEFSLWRGGTIVAGLDSNWVSGNSQFNRIAPAPQGSFNSPTFRVTSPYVALSQHIDLGNGWSLVPSVGIRVYDHNIFETRTSPHAGLSLISERVTIFGNVSRGIHYPGLEAPVLSTLIPPLGQTWKQLAAEELNHAEVGVKLTPVYSTQIDISLFVDQVKNRYIFGFPPHVPPPPQFLNLGTYVMRGAEIAIRQNITPNWTVFGGLTLLDPSIDNLPYTPKRAVTAGINGQMGPIRLTIDTQYQSSILALSRQRAAGVSNTEHVDSFVIMNARVAHRLPMLGKRGEIFVAMENLLDADYAYRPGYPMPGRWGQIGLAASF
ncbi:MAG: TonB-dependent receptor [Nitrosospira sp.]|nr:TonB-dependent receptor [Nitrosospira sp.]